MLLACIYIKSVVWLHNLCKKRQTKYNLVEYACKTNINTNYTNYMSYHLLSYLYLRFADTSISGC